MTVTVGYGSPVGPGEPPASVGPSSSHLPLTVLDAGRSRSLPFATPPTSVLPSGPTFGLRGGWSDDVFSYVTYSHLAEVYSEFSRVVALIDRTTEVEPPSPLDELIIQTVAADPITAMAWTERTFTLESTPDSSIPILRVDGFEEFEDTED